MPEYAAFTIPFAKLPTDKIIRGPRYYVWFGEPWETFHFDCYAPWMAPPKPKKIPMLDTCPSCGSKNIEHECITSSYWIHCGDCGHRSPRLNSPGGMFVRPGTENQVSEYQGGSSSPAEIAAFFRAVVEASKCPS